MEKHEDLKLVYKTLHSTLQESAAPYNLLIIISMVIVVAISAAFELFDGLAFFLLMGIYFVGIYFLYKKMMRDPLITSLEEYTSAIRQSRLTGDELLALKVLPTKADLNRFRKYNIALQREGAQKLFTGLKNLNFSGDHSQIDASYHETINTIRGFNE